MKHIFVQTIISDKVPEDNSFSNLFNQLAVQQLIHMFLCGQYHTVIREHKFVQQHMRLQYTRLHILVLTEQDCGYVFP